MRIARKSLISTVMDRVARAGVNRILARGQGSERGRFFVLPGDYIGSTIIAEGAFEKGYLAALDELIGGARACGLFDAARPVALDIGANIGTHSVFLSRHFPQVHSFEPNAMIHHVLCANLALNGFSTANAHLIALSDRAETLGYHQDHAGNLGGSHFERSSEAGDGSTPMPLVRGDEFMLSALAPGERVVFIKIDVEGLEDKVVAGLSRLLERDEPILVIELADRETGERVRAALRGMGYGHLYEINNPSRYGAGGVCGGLWRAVSAGIEYNLQPLGAIDDRIYPMVVASRTDLVAALTASARCAA